MIGTFWVDDQPLQPVYIDLTRDDEHVETAAYSGATATLIAPEGTTTNLPATLGDSAVTVSWDGTVFDLPGVWSIRVALTANGLRETLDPIRFVVQGEDGWHNLASAREEWFTQGKYSDVQLWTLLECAKLSVVTYAPSRSAEVVQSGGFLVMANDAPVPVNLRQAQLLQARNIANTAITDPMVLEQGTYAIRPYPLDAFVRELIRPRKAVPNVG